MVIYLGVIVLGFFFVAIFVLIWHENAGRERLDTITIMIIIINFLNIAPLKTDFIKCLDYQA